MACPMCKQNPCRCFSGHHCKDWAFLIMRLALGSILIYHGYGKLFGHMPDMKGFTGMVAGLGFPMPAVFAWLSALTEFIGGFAMVFGVLARLFGGLIVINMLVAFIAVHHGRLGLGDADLSMLAIALGVMIAGPGKFSLMRGACGSGKGCGCADSKQGGGCCMDDGKKPETKK